MSATAWPEPPPIAASLAYSTLPVSGAAPAAAGATTTTTNTDPFVLSPVLNLPPAFGSAYVGETFACTLCANHEELVTAAPGTAAKKKIIRDVRLEAEMKTPGARAPVKLELLGADAARGEEQGGHVSAAVGPQDGSSSNRGVDLDPGQTLQRIVSFDLKEEGSHVLAVTVSYYEATETSGRTRSFRKLYQFVCKGSLIVRTKVGPLPFTVSGGSGGDVAAGGKGKVVGTGSGAGGTDGGRQQQLQRRRWVLEAQLENCSEDVLQLERVLLDLEPGLGYTDCNWESIAGAEDGGDVFGNAGLSQSKRPVLHPGEVEQVCFVVEELPGPDGDDDAASPGLLKEQPDGRIMFGVLGISWRSEMGNRGYISTGRLGTRFSGR